MNKVHLSQDGTVVDAKQREARKEEVRKLYKKSIENEKLFSAQRTMKLAFLEAVESRDESSVRHLLETWADFQEGDLVENSAFSEAILWAAEVGNMNVLSLLLEKGVPIDVKGRYGNTPASLAARNGQMAVVQLLLEKGLEIDAPVEGEKTILSCAAENGRMILVKFLLKRGANIEGGTNAGSPLLWASGCGRDDIVRFLLEQGAKVDVHHRWDDKPLHKAASGGHEAIVRVLLEYGAPLDNRGFLGHTPLHRAVYSGKRKVVQQLLEAGADIGIRDCYGRHLLFSSWSEEIKLLLREHAARIGHSFDR